MRWSGRVIFALAAGASVVFGCKGGNRRSAESATVQGESTAGQAAPAESTVLQEAPGESTTTTAKQPAAAKPAASKPAPSKPVAPVPDPRLAAKAGLTVYPAKGQPQPQQVDDERACYEWAQQNTGIDPTATAVNADSAGKAAKAQTDSASRGAAVGGAARGAVGGAVIGGIAGDAGTGAAIGAVAGAAKGRKARKTAGAQAEQAGQQQAAGQSAATQETFAKAMAACLQGRGYTVN